MAHNGSTTVSQGTLVIGQNATMGSAIGGDVIITSGGAMVVNGVVTAPGPDAPRIGDTLVSGGRLTIGATGRYYADQSVVDPDYGALVVEGSGQMTANGLTSLQTASATINGSASLADLQTADALVNVDVGGSLAVANALFRGGSTTVAGTFAASSGVTVAGGATNVLGVAGYMSDGDTALAGTTTSVGGSFTSRGATSIEGGSTTVASGGTFTSEGAMTVSGGTTAINAGGAMTSGGRATIQNGRSPWTAR